MTGIFGTSRKDEDSDWLSVSDLMAGLMVIFLFLAIVYIRPFKEQNERIAEIAETWQETETSIFKALEAEFQDDLPKWNAEIDEKTLLVRFKSPEVLFQKNQSTIGKKFEDILSDFFPRYVGVLSEYRSTIDEIRIEGHTSSEWHNSTPNEAYFGNMGLSQERTRAVLKYSLSLSAIKGEREWVQSVLTANGLSSSRLILDENGKEDPNQSRRVEFRVRTKVREKIVRILEEVR